MGNVSLDLEKDDKKVRPEIETVFKKLFKVASNEHERLFETYVNGTCCDLILLSFINLVGNFVLDNTNNKEERGKAFSTFLNSFLEWIDVVEKKLECHWL